MLHFPSSRTTRDLLYITNQRLKRYKACDGRCIGSAKKGQQQVGPYWRIGLGLASCDYGLARACQAHPSDRKLPYTCLFWRDDADVVGSLLRLCSGQAGQACFAASRMVVLSGSWLNPHANRITGQLSHLLVISWPDTRLGLGPLRVLAAAIRGASGLCITLLIGLATPGKLRSQANCGYQLTIPAATSERDGGCASIFVRGCVYRS